MTEPTAALRPLQAVRESLATLRIGSIDSDTERSALLRVTDAVEASLRRALRDDPAIPLETRLRALAGDEVPASELISALRQRNRISIELAAAFHDLLAIRRRLQAGGLASRRDSELALEVVERLERELALPPATPEAPPADIPAASDAALADPVVAYDPYEHPPRSLVGTSRGMSWRWIGAVAVLLLIVALGLWWASSRGPTLDEGITLFRAGDYARAAAHFERLAESRPRDSTPRLYLARIHRRTQRFEEASTELRRALEITPSDAALHRELGFLLLDVHQPDAAVERFRSAIELDPESTEGWMGLIRALLENDQAAAADRVLARAPAEVRALLQERSGGSPATPTP